MGRRTYKRVHGYDIRVQREGSDDLREKLHGWGMENDLPQEWEQVKNDPTVVRAVIFPSYQRTWRSGNRRHSDEYRRS